MIVVSYTVLALLPVDLDGFISRSALHFPNSGSAVHLVKDRQQLNNYPLCGSGGITAVS